MKGDSAEVLVLTQARAMNVRDYLVEHFRMDDTPQTTGVSSTDAGVPENGWAIFVGSPDPSKELTGRQKCKRQALFGIVRGRCLTERRTLG